MLVMPNLLFTGAGVFIALAAKSTLGRVLGTVIAVFFAVRFSQLVWVVFRRRGQLRAAARQSARKERDSVSPSYPRLRLAQSTSEQDARRPDSQELPSLPPITAEVEPMFDYVALDSSRMPPDLHLVARLARSYSEENGGAERLRLALVAGHPVDSHDLLILAYIWRGETHDVVWGLERWRSPERRLVLYRLDPDFESLPARQLHLQLQQAGAAKLAEQARAVLAA